MVISAPYQWHLSASLVPAASFVVALTLGFLSLIKRIDHPRAVTACISIPLLVALCNANNVSPDPKFNTLFAYATLIWMAHICYLHCFLSITKLIPMRRTKSSPTEEHLRTQDSYGDLRDARNWLQAYKVLLSSRVTPVTATSQQVWHRQADNGLHNRFAFVGRQILLILGKYLVLCICLDPVLDLYSNFGPDRHILFRRIMCRVTHRLGSPFCNSSEFSTDTTAIMRGGIIRFSLLVRLILYDYCRLSASHDAFAALAVSTGLDTPDEWLPLFGDIREAYTVRKFWSHFWHQLICNSFSAFARHFSGRVLHIQRGTLLARYSNNIFVFILSGLMHVIVMHIIHSDCTTQSTFLYLLMQTGAIFVEDMVHILCRTVVEKRWIKGHDTDKRWRIAKRLLGYIWVVIWLTYCTAVEQFVEQHCLSS